MRAAALDLFSGTSRVGRAWKGLGVDVTAVDTTRTAEVLARCYVGTDATSVDPGVLDAAIGELDALEGRPGYVTEVFCSQARYFQPANGDRIDAIRGVIAARWAGSDLEPVLLTALLEAADRVDSTTGVQMAFLKSWAPRSHNRLTLRSPELLPGPGAVVRGDAVDVVTSGRLEGAWRPAGSTWPTSTRRTTSTATRRTTTCGRRSSPATSPSTTASPASGPTSAAADYASAFNRRATIGPALGALLDGIDARVVALSYNDEAWVQLDDLVEMSAAGGRRHVEVVAFDSPRYVGSRIGIHNPAGEKVGAVTRTRNVEYLVLASEQPGRSPAGSGKPRGRPNRSAPSSWSNRMSVTMGVRTPEVTPGSDRCRARARPRAPRPAVP